MSVAANGVIIVVPPWLLVVAAMICAVYVVWVRGCLPKHWQPVSADVNFAGLGKLTIAPDTLDTQIAHRAWVELATRKAGVAFDRDHDIIIEIYNSWYELFGRLRELARECPATRLRCDANTRRLVWSLTQVLNDGFRPHRGFVNRCVNSVRRRAVPA